MNIRIVAVGKIKEKYLKSAINEYLKRLSAYCRLEIIEVKDEKIPEKSSDAQRMKALEIEGKRILPYLRDEDILITLEIHGHQMDSPAFAKKIENYGIQGKSQLTFVIGGSIGLSSEITNCSNWKLSFSEMTFPHQLFRVLLLEQLYRAFKINRGETYHK
ncbi:23S rRNA (pseudouridine(1915)-N(3))-methyltransferase RlmH [Acetobacterium paludosum]|uniref:Ribosomal RNA large subunit methyltransferase H n=1 Tax=Acetobacterium paludosum TaxID=52693 RepID=A0A923KP36_9FIRM|nr:23S rRNA (pseudouridine(1915)-N(3))-methyltransferase RlmH [Acetobacterium paludosum]MBC3887734.1 23S rRNA (pseudouridine(1915)-N(3))-methyltransferase RlmH [Acetobacterium paludosum]